jgi:hypothetical protein
MSGNKESEYTWGVDGYGRCHICKRQSNVVLFCMIGEGGGQCGVWILEAQDLDEKFERGDYEL